MMEFIGSLVSFLFAIFIYFLPFTIAVSRECKHQLPIFVLNFFLGWTFLGWVGAMVWAVMSEKHN